MKTEELEALADLARNTGRIANAITGFDGATGTDAAGGYVGCLTEAVMGMTGGLVRIAEAIEILAEAIGGRE